MNTLTKEWLQNTITSIESARDEIPFGLDEDQNDMLTALKIALASLAAVSDERAAYELFMEKRFGESVDRRRAKNGDREYMAWDMALGWIIWCHRAAMLQAEPVSNSDELPLDYLQGHKDGLEWAAQLAEANHPQTGDWLYDDQIDLARAIRKGPDMPTVQGGNSPVIPDGWVMVPVEPTIAILDEFDSIIDYGAEDSKDAWSRLLAAAWIKSLPAAPRQEVK
ncbi:hypothetical protein G917_01313 [Escherichia coli UMEA 3148-1]|uniref:hypothetical protein n=1 Tax=Escherichia coli TaxID=562 RepID=UPI0002A3E7B3|nr:hypothetical protein [Escherichia coli]ELE99827.1 hypothetical protein A1WY_01880 [Escherichia coli KTE111]EQX85747.1 hypothetical protein G937_01313 [Escherichia coli UMEA 3199-1]ESP47525.1 hypothetical protein G917_01313 [Escherichia coli UMEA 3148-1]WCE47388.1 hypothetical protein PL328_12895 [Escherichia coli]